MFRLLAASRLSYLFLFRSFLPLTGRLNNPTDFISVSNPLRSPTYLQRRTYLDVGNAIFDNPMSCRPPSIIIKTGVEHVQNPIAAQPSFFLAVFSFPCSLAPLLLVPAPSYGFQVFGAVPEDPG